MQGGDIVKQLHLFETEPQHCPFCIFENRIFVAANDYAFAIYDGHPISQGHTLVIPRKHIASLFDLKEDEYLAVWKIVIYVKNFLKDKFNPDSFNIGLNDGPAAGQTVPHAHIHVIPRYNGDVVDPRGGVRWIIPEKAKYWK